MGMDYSSLEVLDLKINILKDAYNLLRDKTRHTTYAAARTYDGICCTPNSKHAVQWSLDGACYAVSDSSSVVTHLLWWDINNVSNMKYGIQFTHVNDEEGHSKVVELLKETRFILLLRRMKETRDFYIARMKKNKESNFIYY